MTQERVILFVVTVVSAMPGALLVRPAPSLHNLTLLTKLTKPERTADGRLEGTQTTRRTAQNQKPGDNTIQKTGMIYFNVTVI